MYIKSQSEVDNFLYLTTKELKEIYLKFKV